MKFKNRHDAGLLLAIKLKEYKSKNATVLAIPRGGVPIGSTIAKALSLPLEIVFSKKIGHPNHKEFAIGAVTLSNRILSDAAIDVSDAYIELETEIIRDKLKKRFYYYYGAKHEMNLQGKILLLVDDGIATGNTMLSIIHLLADEKPSKIIIAIPVAPKSVVSKLQNSPYVDEIICLLTPSDFQAVGQFYEDFEEVTDEDVKQLLEKDNSGVA